MKELFNVKAFCNSKYSSSMENLLICFDCAITKALKDNARLPRFIVVVMDDDIVKFTNFDKYGVSK